MCGIAGVVSLSRSTVADLDGILRSMLATVAHRGPDDDGIWVSPRGDVGLAASRLALTDPGPEAAQPMVDQGGGALVFNGFVSNYRTLREQLGSGWSFRSEGDTECILAAGRRWPDELTDHLWGMYALGWWDGERLQLSRDPTGAKPLYYALAGDLFMFASDVRALVPRLKPSYSLSGLAEYLVFQYPVSAGTTFQGISRVLPGETLYVSADGLASRRSTDAAVHRPVLAEPAGAGDAAAGLRDLVLDAAQRYLPGQDRSAVTLSGGLDSSSVLAAVFATGGRPEALHGCVSGEPACDESPYAREISAGLACDLREISFSRKTFMAALPAVIRELGQPVAGAGSVNQYIVAKAAAERGIRVLLGGQGGDELFGGYVRYSVLERMWSQQSVAALVPDIPASYTSWAGSFRSEGLDPAATYLEMIDRRDGVRQEWDWLDSEAVGAEVAEDFRATLALTRSCVAAATGVDLRWNIPALLQVDDSVCMAHGIEPRVPLLDDAIRDHVLGLPVATRFGATRKSLLIEAMSPYVPRSILARSDKMGFPIPLTAWLLSGGPGWLLDVLKNSAARGRPWALRDPEAYVSGLETRPHSRSVWGLVSLELWAMEYLDGR